MPDLLSAAVAASEAACVPRRRATGTGELARGEHSPPSRPFTYVMQRLVQVVDDELEAVQSCGLLWQAMSIISFAVNAYVWCVCACVGVVGVHCHRDNQGRLGLWATSGDTPPCHCKNICARVAACRCIHTDLSGGFSHTHTRHYRRSTNSIASRVCAS